MVLSLEDDKGVLGGGGRKHPEGFGFLHFLVPFPSFLPFPLSLSLASRIGAYQGQGIGQTLS